MGQAFLYGNGENGGSGSTRRSENVNNSTVFRGSAILN